MYINYVVIPEEGAEHVIEGEVWEVEGRIGCSVLRKVTPTERIAKIGGFDPNKELIYYDAGATEGYIRISDVKAIIDLETLTEKELEQASVPIEDL